MKRNHQLTVLPRAEHWADRICVQLGKTVESILEVGRLLLKAKADLPHGEWGRLFDEQLLPFSKSWAAMFMAVAGNQLLANFHDRGILPPAVGTLYELAKADPAKLKAALKDGSITPDMKRRDITALLPGTKKGHRPRARSDVSARTAGGRLYFQINRLLSEQFDSLAPEDQASVLGLLEQTLAELRERRGTA